MCKYDIHSTVLFYYQIAISPFWSHFTVGCIFSNCWIKPTACFHNISYSCYPPYTHPSEGHYYSCFSVHVVKSMPRLKSGILWSATCKSLFAFSDQHTFVCVHIFWHHHPYLSSTFCICIVMWMFCVCIVGFKNIVNHNNASASLKHNHKLDHFHK